jgi:hypothetical protein
MRVLFRRAAVITGAAAVVLGSAAGMASAGGAPALRWSWTAAGPVGSFGAGLPGSAMSQALKLTNGGGSGTADMKITISGSAFTLSADHCTGTSLGPHKSCTVTVAYTASSPGGTTDTGTLTAKGVKPNTTATVNLQGESQPPAPASVTFGSFVTIDPAAGGPGVSSWLVSVAGFSPNTAITFTATGTGIELAEFPGSDTTDSSGNIGGGNAGLVGADCEGQQITVTATDGVHTASATETLPASC